MHPKPIQLFLFIVAFAAGCCSLNEKPRNAGTPEDTIVNAPAFSEQEIRSKTWDDTQGHNIRLLGWSVISFKLRGELIIAKYGDTNTGFVTCLEFYRVIQNWTPKAQNSFVLLYHDYNPYKVTSVQPVEVQDNVGIAITRETITGTAKPSQQLRYTLPYERDYRMIPDFGMWIWNIPQR